MRVIFLSSLLVICFLIPVHALAEPTIHPGEYITEGGWGNLKIREDKNNGLSFEIYTVGGNAHTCELSGVIVKLKGVLEEGEDGKRCIVDFTPTEEGINVTDNGGACRGYCGARADFVSLYLKPKPVCTPAAVKATRNEFKKLYGQKAYVLAKAKLEPVLNDCFNILDWWELGWIRNDQAITMHKLGDDKGCREVLKPLQEEANEADEDIRGKYGPMVEESAIRLVKATRTNMKLCK